MNDVSETAAKKRPNVTTETSSDGLAVEIKHDDVAVGRVVLSDIHHDAHNTLIMAGARALLASARDPEGVAARIAALKAGKTSTRSAAAPKEHPPIIRAIALAKAHEIAAASEPKVPAKLPGNKPNPAFEAILSTATTAALALTKEERKAAGKLKAVMLRLADLVGE